MGAKATIMKMKIVNPVAGAVARAERTVKSAKRAHQYDVKQASTAARNAALVADGHAVGSAAGSATMSPQRQADLKLQQEIVMSHMSKTEVMDAQNQLNKQRRLYTSLQAKLKGKRKALAKKAA